MSSCDCVGGFADGGPSHDAGRSNAGLHDAGGMGPWDAGPWDAGPWDAGIDPTSPHCVISVDSVNGETTGDDVAPLDNVIVTAAESLPWDSGGSIVSYTWTLVEKPVHSTAELTSATGVETGFVFGADIFGVDVAGQYKLSATVTDESGTTNTNVCEYTISAVPPQSVYVQLTWSADNSDLDLLLSRQEVDGRYCVIDDLGAGAIGELCANPGPEYTPCYYGTCRAYGIDPASPDWDGDGVFLSDGDPSLDIDNFAGFGPETITVVGAEPGRYLVGVGHFSGVPAEATLSVYLEQQFIGDYTKSLVEGDFWEVGIIGLTGDAPCVEDLSTEVIECP